MPEGHSEVEVGAGVGGEAGALPFSLLGSEGGIFSILQVQSLWANLKQKSGNQGMRREKQSQSVSGQ